MRTGVGWFGWQICAVLLVTACAIGCEKELPRGQSQTVPGSTGAISLPEDDLIAALRASFQQKNSKLGQVGVLDLKSWDFEGPRVVVGWAIVKGRVFRGDFSDEMFGVFVVNDSLTRVERVVDMYPTPRWFDYEVRFGRLTADSVEVLGRGATYGDDPQRRIYKWR
jgi:hypothetical protein